MVSVECEPDAIEVPVHPGAPDNFGLSGTLKEAFGVHDYGHSLKENSVRKEAHPGGAHVNDYSGKRIPAHV